MFNFQINCIIMVGQEVTWGSSGGKQTCKYQRTTAANCEEGRVSGQRDIVYMDGKESKPPIKEGEWMFYSLFVHAFLLCSELLSAFLSSSKILLFVNSFREYSQMFWTNGHIQSSGVSGCRFSPFYYSFGCSKYPEP